MRKTEAVGLDSALAQLCAHAPLTQEQANARAREWLLARRARDRRNALIAFGWIVIITVATVAVMRHDPAWLLVAGIGGAFAVMVPIGYELSSSAWDDDPFAVLALYECTEQDLRRIREVCDRSPQAATIVRQWLASGNVLRTRELLQLIRFDHALTEHEAATGTGNLMADPALVAQ